MSVFMNDNAGVQTAIPNGRRSIPDIHLQTRVHAIRRSGHIRIVPISNVGTVLNFSQNAVTTQPLTGIIQLLKIS